jgi:sterol desaturase/sphingolipid hydroxylase (fatty acid hydroxylase superfamily)
MSVTKHPPINQDKEPIRVFKSDFLEAFTHVHWVTVPILWVPVVLVCLALAIAGHLGTPNASSASGTLSTSSASAFPWYIPIGYLVGLVLWTLAEYNVHRFVFHLRPRAPWQERMVYLAHGIHHHQPHCKTRLVLPPAFSVPLAVIFCGLFYLVITVVLGAGHWLLPVFAGFLTGYITYDLIHYATHHAPVRGRVWKYLKKHHMYHHFKTPNDRYGVSSPLWDYVYGTLPA